MAGWGIPVGCMPDGPSIREWGNLTEGGRVVNRKRKTRMTKRKRQFREMCRVGGREDDECQSESEGFCKQQALKA